MQKAVSTFVPRAKQVFVVDDEYVIATTLALILRKKGFDASAYTSAHAALEAANVMAPDLLLSDVAMPGLSGVSLAILITDRHPQCKVLLFSGQAATADLLQDAKREGHDFLLLAKPIHPSDMLHTVRTLLEHPSYSSERFPLIRSIRVEYSSS